MAAISTKSPWIIHSKQSVYDNDWLTINHHEVTNPSGNPGIYGVVHFKNFAIGIIPLDHEYNTWLVGQYRFPLDVYTWEIPEGGCPVKLEPLETAKRELAEETGLRANKWTHLLDLQVSNSVTDELGSVFVAQDLQMGVAAPEDTEELQVKKFPFEQVYQMVMNGQIKDSISVAAILKVKIWMMEGKL